MANRTSRRKVRASIILLILHALWDKTYKFTHKGIVFTVTYFAASLFVMLLWAKVPFQNYIIGHAIADNIFVFSYKI